MPRVSVLLPVFNGERLVRRAVDSVLSQEFDDFELVVTDDGSTDDTARILESIADPRLRVIRQRHAGLVASLTVSAHLATSPFLARMDADDESLPGRLGHQVDLLERRPAVVAVGASYEVVDADDNLVWVQGVLTDADDLRDSLFASPISPFAHGSVVMRSSAFHSVGGYRTGTAAEDFDLWARLSNVGELVAVPDVLYRWRMSPAGLGNSRASAIVADARSVVEQLWRDGSPRVRTSFDIRRRLRHYAELNPQISSLLQDRYCGLVIDLASEMRAHGHLSNSRRQLLAFAMHSPRSVATPILRSRSGGSVSTVGAYLKQRRLARNLRPTA